jgi:hypothetical protein
MSLRPRLRVGLLFEPLEPQSVNMTERLSRCKDCQRIGRIWHFLCEFPQYPLHFRVAGRITLSGTVVFGLVAQWLEHIPTAVDEGFTETRRAGSSKRRALTNSVCFGPD